MLMGDDAPPRYLTTMDDWGGEVMRRLDDGWCAALDRDTMRCTIYERRPGLCRDYEMGDSDCLVERRRYANSHPGSFLVIAATVNS
jgi:Fe-S-cluster containining protein